VKRTGQQHMYLFYANAATAKPSEMQYRLFLNMSLLIIVQVQNTIREIGLPNGSIASSCDFLFKF